MRLKLLFTGMFALLISACVSPYKNLKPMEFSELNYPFPVQFVTLGDTMKMAYVDEGTGSQTLLFIHGLGSYLPAWQKNIAELSKHYRCIALDLPGYGQSDKGLYPYGMAYYAYVVREFMNALGIEKAILAGHSMGGQIAMTLAIQHPEVVEKLVLIAPAGFEKFSPGEAQWLKDVITTDAVKLTPVQQIRANIQLNFYNTPGDAQFMVTDRIALRKASDFEQYCYAVQQSVAAMVDEPVLDYLADISQPTLIIFGENDNLIPNPYLHGGRTRDIAEIGHARIQNSTLVMIPKCGHFAQWEKAQETNSAIADFLSDR